MTIVVPGEPQGKARPRFVRIGKGVKTYTPSTTIEYEDLIRKCWHKDTKGSHIYEDPVVMMVTAYFAIPKRASKVQAQQMREGIILPTKKPDVDNILKVVADALNGFAYEDDKQVVQMGCKKLYGDVPHLIIDLQGYNKKCDTRGSTANSVGWYDTEEIHKNCTVQIWKNSITGEESVGWWENYDEAPPNGWSINEENNNAVQDN